MGERAGHISKQEKKPDTSSGIPIYRDWASPKIMVKDSSLLLPAGDT